MRRAEEMEVVKASNLLASVTVKVTVADKAALSCGNRGPDQ